MSAQLRPLTARLAVCLAVLWAALAVGGASRVSAQSPSPGWSISSLAEPTNFNTADTQDEVETLTVEATAGYYELYANTAENYPTNRIAWNASAAEVQAAIEAVPQIEAAEGNIKVEAGVATATEHTYTITWVGMAPEGLKEETTYTEANLINGSGVGKVKKTLLQQEKAHDRYTVAATNVGSVPTTGVITITDTLPPQLAQARLIKMVQVEELLSHRSHECSLTLHVTITCEYNEPEYPVRPGDKLIVTVYVAVRSPSLTGSLVNEARIEGGGAATVNTNESTAVNARAALFGIDQFAFATANLAGEPDVQAGDHPYGVTATTSFNTVFTTEKGAESTQAHHVPQEAKDVAVELPLGFVGDPLATERCPEVDMTYQTGVSESGHTACPADSIVGEVWLTLKAGTGFSFGPYPVYNVVPEYGYPAELSFNVAGFGQPTFVFASVVPSESGYHVRLVTPGAIRAANLAVERVALTVFGNPSAHNGGTHHAAFVTNPTACSTEPVKARVETTSWEGGLDAREETAYPQVTGCNLLSGISGFKPELKLEPEEKHADTPSGYEVRLKMPKAPDVFGQLATPELKDASVTLPAGLSLSPAAASGPNGLEACTAEQIDLLGVEKGEGARNGSLYDDDETHGSPGHCPEKSQIGDVELKTPLLEEALNGHIYLAQPSCGGAGQPECTPADATNGKLFGIYLEISGSGVIVKLHGNVVANPATGQLTTIFLNNPQLPFEELKLTLYGGPRAPLANPQTCGTATTTTDLEPWSAPESGSPATPSWSFTVTGCANPMGFSPGFSADTAQPFGGGFSPFEMTIARSDGEQDVAGISVTLPPGVAGMISKVPLCGEPRASLGTCHEASRIGTANVAAGAGSQPLSVSGPVYLTGPYKGAPFGLSVVVPAKAGPFDLGNEVVRSAVSVDPHTAQVTVTSDPIPQIKDGIPFRLKTINVTVDHPGFIFNPTNCSQLHVNGAVSGDMPDRSPGATVPVASPFAVAGCKNLPFKPGFSALTHAGHSRRTGEYLHVVVKSGAGQANIAKVHVALPKQLPSRVSTLNLACTEAQFASNPAGCPSGSMVGMATAYTPVLPVPLTGPAIFVSHGGAKFPDLDLVLQGDGVTVILTGNTFISKGVTTSTFASVPDVPVTRFDLVLPSGPHSALGGNGNLCYRTMTKSVKAKINGKTVYRRRHVKQRITLTMPTTITGQNGAIMKQNTKLTVTGCTMTHKKP